MSLWDVLSGHWRFRLFMSFVAVSLVFLYGPWMTLYTYYDPMQ